MRITPNRFTSNKAWSWCTDDSSAPASRPVPALFTRTSILPVASRTLSTAAFTDASSVTSQVTIVIPSRVFATARLLVPNTRNPAWCSAFAEACPIPVEAPVTIATLPSRRIKASSMRLISYWIKR